MQKVRQIGTSDSLVYCKNIEQSKPSLNCIEAIKDFPEEKKYNLLVVRVKDISDSAKFEEINVFDKASSRNALEEVFYFIPILKQREGKNWIIYEISS